MKINKRLFDLAVISFFILAVTILIMPYSSERALNGDRILLYITGGLFWLFLISGYFVVLLLKSRMKKVTRKKRQEIKTSIFKMFGNRLLAIIDSLMIINFIIFMICIATKASSSYITCISLSIIIFTVHMHCLLNSKLYYQLK